MYSGALFLVRSMKSRLKLVFPHKGLGKLFGAERNYMQWAVDPEPQR